MNDNMEIQHPHRQYLGDSVYVDWDGYNIVLQTDNGMGIDQQIFVEPEVFEKLCTYVEELHRKLEQK